MADTGLACALLGLDAAALHKDRQRLGPLLETFALQELRRQASWRAEHIDFFHYRDRDDFEVDIVLEQGSMAVAGVEGKAAATVTEADFRGLRKLRDVAGSRFTAGVVLYDGNASINFGERLFAVPLRQLWEYQVERAGNNGARVQERAPPSLSPLPEIQRRRRHTAL